MNYTEKDKVIEIAKYFTWMGEDGIARTKVKKDAEITIEDSRANTVAVETFFYGKKYPLIIDSTEIKSITKEARDHFSMKGRKTVVSALAIIIKSPLSRIIGNFFMGLNKPVVPVKLVDSEKEAVKWIKQYL